MKQRLEKIKAIHKKAYPTPSLDQELETLKRNVLGTNPDVSLEELKRRFNIGESTFDTTRSKYKDISLEELKSMVGLGTSSVPAVAAPDNNNPTESRPTPAVEESAEYGSRDLRYGDKGSDVKELQQRLIGKGYYISGRGQGNPDGAFGKGTKNAIIYFQVLNRLSPIDGVATISILNMVKNQSSIGPKDTLEPHPEAERLQYTDRDVEAAARGLVVETGFRANYREMAGIVWVMINRSKKWDMPIYKVIDPDTGGGKNWYGGLSQSNRRRWKNAHKRSDFEYIKRFVKTIFDGVSFQNEIGDRAHFLHPGGMPRVSGEPGSACGSRNHRVVVDTGRWGKRCLPKWNIDGNTNMAGRARVQLIGNARFS